MSETLLGPPESALIVNVVEMAEVVTLVTVPCSSTVIIGILVVSPYVPAVKLVRFDQ